MSASPDAPGPHLNHVIHDGDGPPIFLVHGALASRSYWNENLDALRTVGTPVVFELWGHGQSASPDDLSLYEPSNYAAEFDRVRAALGAEQVAVVGQSMGAALSLHYVYRHPERVTALVMTNSTSAFSTVSNWEHRHATMVMDRAKQVRADGVESLRDNWINPSRSRRIPDATRAELAREFGEHTTEGIVRTFEVTNRALPLGDQLASIATPSLLTVGVDEERFQPLIEVARLIPGIEIVDIEANHAVNAQNPDQWNAVVVEFLQRHGRSHQPSITDQ